MKSITYSECRSEEARINVLRMLNTPLTMDFLMIDSILEFNGYLRESVRKFQKIIIERSE